MMMIVGDRGIYKRGTAAADNGGMGEWRIMKRNITIVAVVVSAVVLAGCSAPSELGRMAADVQSAQETSGTVDAEPPAFHFASGTLELGDFEYAEIKDDFFDPCTEISAEEFAAQGLRPVSGTIHDPEADTRGCGLVRKGGDIVYFIGTTPSIEDALNRTVGFIGKDVSDVIPNAFLFEGRDPDVFGCVAAVNTRRGQLSLAAAVNRVPYEMDELCASALKELEKLYRD